MSTRNTKSWKEVAEGYRNRLLEIGLSPSPAEPEKKFKDTLLKEILEEPHLPAPVENKILRHLAGLPPLKLEVQEDMVPGEEDPDPGGDEG